MKFIIPTPVINIEFILIYKKKNDVFLSQEKVQTTRKIRAVAGDTILKSKTHTSDTLSLI